MEKMVDLPIYTVDAFTDVPFSGNPAAVCLLEAGQELSDVKMQNIGAEMNLSETAFIRLLNQSDSFRTSSRFGLRWFTPTVEVALCGHATLASAAVLFRCVGNSSDAITFDTLSGPLTVKRDGNNIVMDMPNNNPVKLQDSELAELDDLIKLAVGNLKVKDVRLAPAVGYLLIRLADSLTLQDFLDLKPDTDRMLKMPYRPHSMLPCVIVTLKGSSDGGCVSSSGTKYDFVSRFFAPWTGVNEDPVTGSAHTVLGPYWSAILNKTRLFGRQCSLRGGDVTVTVRDDKRVDVAGRAVIVLRGTLSTSST